MLHSHFYFCFDGCICCMKVQKCTTQGGADVNMLITISGNSTHLQVQSDTDVCRGKTNRFRDATDSDGNDCALVKLKD